MSKRGKNGTDRIRLLLAGVCMLGFVCCAVWLIRYYVQTYRAEEQYQALQESVEMQMQEEHQQTETTQNKEASEEEVPERETVGDVSEERYPGLEGYEVPEKEIDFAALQQEENEHIYAWITIPGTVIDYPIVQHPEVLDYYLDYNLDGSKGYPGGIYTQYFNSMDWEDPNTVIYGHNMKNGTMFAGLHQYEDPEFFQEYPYVYIYSPDRVRVYQIFAAYEYTDINLITFFRMPGVMSYEEYLESIYTIDGMKNNFNTELQVTAEDKIITLSTCVANKPSRRYLVQAVLVAEGAASEE